MVSNQIEELKKKYEEEARDRKELFAQEIERLKKQNEEEMKKKGRNDYEYAKEVRGNSGRL